MLCRHEVSPKQHHDGRCSDEQIASSPVIIPTFHSYLRVGSYGSETSSAIVLRRIDLRDNGPRNRREPLLPALRISANGLRMKPRGRSQARLCPAGRTLYMRPASRKDIRMPATSVLDLIGKTPLVEVTRFDSGPCRLFLKLEIGKPERLDQGPAGARDDRRRRGGRALEGGRHGRRGDRRQHRRRACARSPRARATAPSSSCPTRCRARRSCTPARSAPR